MTNTIFEYIRSLVPDPIFRSGQALFESGAVLDAHTQAKTVEARVANESGRFESVSISFRTNGIASRCSCRVRVPICDHATAVLLRVAETNPDFYGFLGFGDDSAKSKSEIGAPLASVPGRSPAPTADGSSRKEAYQGYFSSLISPERASHCALYLHLLDANKALESRWQNMHIKATLQAGDRSYSAGNMRKMLDGVKAAGDMQLTDFTPRERQIIRFLCMHATPQDASVFEMDAIRAADLFHCLIGFERFFTENEQIHVHGQHADPCMVITSKEDETLVKGRLELPGTGVLPEGRVVPIAGRGGVWIGVQSHYWWLAGIIDPGWLRFFVHSEEVAVTEGQASELLRAAHEGRVRARILREDTTEEVAIDRPECTPVLSLDWQGPNLTGELEFDYGSVRVAPLDRRGGQTGAGYIVRDAEEEAEAANHLRRLGFTWSSAGRCYTLTNKTYLWTFLHEALGHMESTWRLFMSPVFVRKWQTSDNVQLSLQTVDEGERWFELQADLPEAENAGLSWDDITQACQAGEEYVAAEDGTIMHIPQDVRQLVELLTVQAKDQEENRLSFDISSAFPIGDSVVPYLGEQNPTAVRWRKLRNMFLNPDLKSRPVELPEDLNALLRDYQREGIAWLSMLEETGFHGILADEMGLGKTIQALAALVRRHQQNQTDRPSLVVCPTSLIENWLIEAKRFAPQLKTLAVRGLQRKHLIERLPEIDLAVTSYSLLRRDVELYEKQHLDYLILDEAQHIKNPGTANAKTCKSLRADHRLILTGTPLENSLREVWSLFDFLLPGFLGTQKEFRQRFGNAASGSEDPTAVQELAASIRPFILRRTKDDVCKQLPPKIEQVVYCHLNAKQQKIHQNLLSAGREMVRIARKEGWNTRRFQLLSVIMRLRQVCCHPHLLPDNLLTDELREAPSAKTELLKEIIEEAIDGGHRILLFSQFTSFLRILKDWLVEEEIPYEYLDGSTQDRQARVDHFNNDASIPIFLLSLKAGGTGLNLTGADTVIHYDQWWNPMVEDQATDRTHRIGQEKPVTVYKLVARHSIEERIRNLQLRKRKIFDQIMDGAPTKPGELSDEDFEFLFGAPGKSS